MTLHEFDASTSSPRHAPSAAETTSVTSPSPDADTSAAPTEFHASIADVTNEQHQNMPGLVQPADFNAGVIVRFLRDNGIDARADEVTERFRFTLSDPARAEHVRFACVCLRASISY